MKSRGVRSGGGIEAWGGGENGTPQSVLAILTELGRTLPTTSEGTTAVDLSACSPQAEEQPGENPEENSRYDFDLAEFPLFRLYKNALASRGREPLVYSDTIEGRDGERVVREWRAYPGPFGFGGPSTQVLLYDLLQLYAEQGCQGSQLQFGTIRSLLTRRGERNPSKRDYERVRRDMDILRGYDFHCKNAFWDRARGAYADMKWRLFGAVFYFKERPVGTEEELPFGFVEVSPVLQEIARSRGFFNLGFSRDLFYAMKPLEQRLAVYLAKKFVSQKVHQRYVEELARALPIEASRPRDVRAILKATAGGLLGRQLPILRSFALRAGRDDRWLAVFERKKAPVQRFVHPPRQTLDLSAREELLVGRLVEATASPGDRLWWARCVKHLGPGPVERGLGLLEESCRGGQVKNRAAFLTRILKDLAEEAGLSLRQ